MSSYSLSPLSVVSCVQATLSHLPTQLVDEAKAQIEAIEAPEKDKTAEIEHKLQQLEDEARLIAEEHSIAHKKVEVSGCLSSVCCVIIFALITSFGRRHIDPSVCSSFEVAFFVVVARWPCVCCFGVVVVDSLFQ